MVGSCKHADISVFSFHPVKTITTAEGGLLVTNSKKIDAEAKKIKNHNILRGKNYWDYDIKRLSLNYRLSDINCALGIAQLKKINLFLKKRKKNLISIIKKILKNLIVVFLCHPINLLKMQVIIFFNKHRFCKY